MSLALLLRPLAPRDVGDKTFDEEKVAGRVMDRPATGQDPDLLPVLAVEFQLAPYNGGSFSIGQEQPVSFLWVDIKLPLDIAHARNQLVGRRVAQDASHCRIRAQDTPVGRDSPD